jgi:hypothetical protein
MQDILYPRASVDNAARVILFRKEVPVQAVVCVATAIRAYLEKLAGRRPPNARFDHRSYFGFYRALTHKISAMTDAEAGMFATRRGEWASQYVFVYY